MYREVPGVYRRPCQTILTLTWIMIRGALTTKPILNLRNSFSFKSFNFGRFVFRSSSSTSMRSGGIYGRIKNKNLSETMKEEVEITRDSATTILNEFLPRFDEKNPALFVLFDISNTKIDLICCRFWRK